MSDALPAIAAALRSRAVADAVATRLRASPDPAAILDRAHALVFVDPQASADLAARAAEAPPAGREGEAQALAALHGRGWAPAPSRDPLALAAQLRHAADVDLARALDDARRACTAPLAAAWLGVAIGARGLEARTEGETTAIIEPDRFEIRLPDATIALRRAHRRFALLWALATAPVPPSREALFERAWGRPWQGDDDATALQTTVSRTRSQLPKGLDLASLPGGTYTLQPRLAVYVERSAPRSDVPLAPLGRDAEAAAVRLALREHGVAVVCGPPGAGTTHLARAVAASWPGDAVYADLRAGPPDEVVAAQLGVPKDAIARALDGRLVVLDHADAVDRAPWPEVATLFARTAPIEGLPAIEIGPLVPRDAAALAKAIGVDPPDGPATPLAVRLAGAPALGAIRPSARRLLQHLLALPGGAPLARARQLGGDDPLATLEDLAALQQARFVRRDRDRIVPEDALREQIPPIAPPERPAAPPAEPSDALRDRVDLAIAMVDEDLARANVALRQAAVACADRPALKARALAALSEASARTGRPDPSVDAEIAGPLAAALPPALTARHRVGLAVQALWRGELGRAERTLAAAATEARRSGSAAIEAHAHAAAAEVALRTGRIEAVARALDRARALGAPPDPIAGLAAAAALDAGDLDRAAALLANRPARSPFVALRLAQAAVLAQIDPDPHHQAALDGFRRHDRRWIPAVLALRAHARGTTAPLQEAQAALAPGDSASAALIALVRATLDGTAAAAVASVRLPGHADATTFPWDLVRFLVARVFPAAGRLGQDGSLRS